MFKMSASLVLQFESILTEKLVRASVCVCVCRVRVRARACECLCAVRVCVRVRVSVCATCVHAGALCFFTSSQ